VNESVEIDNILQKRMSDCDTPRIMKNSYCT